MDRHKRYSRIEFGLYGQSDRGQFLRADVRHRKVSPVGQLPGGGPIRLSHQQTHHSSHHAAGIRERERLAGHHNGRSNFRKF